MDIDATRKATQDIANKADEVLVKVASNGVNPGTFAICAMLKFIVAQLGVIAITIAERE